MNVTFLGRDSSVDPPENGVTWDEIAIDRKLGDSEDLKAHIQNDLVPAAEERVRATNGHVLIRDTYIQRLACFPLCARIQIRRRPVVSLTWLKYYDTAGVQQALTAGTHFRVIDGTPGFSFVELINGQSWPSTALRADAVEIKFVVGHGESPDEVPAGLRQAVRAAVAKALHPHDDSIPDPDQLAAIFGGYDA